MTNAATAARALLRRLGLLPAQGAPVATDVPELPLVTYDPPVEPAYADEREAKFHTFGITR